MLSHEVSITWAEGFEPADHRYVRETAASFVLRRAGQPPRSHFAGMTIVGWSNLKPDAPNVGVWGRFARRIFWLKPGSDPYPGPHFPSEAVDPKSIRPGVPGTAPRA